MQNLNKIIILLLVIGLIYLILNQEKYLSLEYFNDKFNKPRKKKKHKKEGKKLKHKREVKKLKHKREVKKKKKKEHFKEKTKIDLIEIDELDKLSFEDLNSNITLGTLDTSMSNDDLIDELTIDTFDNELSQSL